MAKNDGKPSGTVMALPIVANAVTAAKVSLDKDSACS